MTRLAINGRDFPRVRLDRGYNAGNIQGSLVSAWTKAGNHRSFELQRAVFPDGLVWGHEQGFLNSKNEGLKSVAIFRVCKGSENDETADLRVSPFTAKELPRALPRPDHWVS
jgi:hypothetical protein